MKRILLTIISIAFFVSCNLNNSEKGMITGYVHYNGTPIEGLRVELFKNETKVVNGETSIWTSPVYANDTALIKGVSVHGITDKNGRFTIDSKYLSNKYSYELWGNGPIYYGQVEFIDRISNIEIKVYKTDINFEIPHETRYSLDTTPLFTWKKYPGAAYYSFFMGSVYSEDYYIEESKLFEPEFQLANELDFNNEYGINIKAYSNKGELLANIGRSFILKKPLIKNSFQGKVTWNNLPLEGITVTARDEEGNNIESVTDENGKYLISGGNFIHGNHYKIRVINSGLFLDRELDYYINFDTSGSDWDFKVVRTDLSIRYPLERTVISESNPTFRWDDYEGVDHYSVTLRGNRYEIEDVEGASKFNADLVENNYYRHNEKLMPNKYSLIINGYNKDFDLVLKTEIFFQIEY